MVFAWQPRPLAVAVLLLSCDLLCEAAAALTATSSVSAAPTCEVRTINYITDSLPQLCLSSSWSNINGSGAKAIDPNDVQDLQTEIRENTSSAVVAQKSSGTANEIHELNRGAEPARAGTPNNSKGSLHPSPTTDADTADTEGGALNDASFLSFEEWKKQTLEKAGQQNTNIGNKKAGAGERRKRDAESIQHNLDYLGDEGEIDIDFGAFRKGADGEPSLQASDTNEAGQESQDAGPGHRKDHYRSKDAGITCKERFSYASFDAGATILKTHSGAKNAKAVLIENKDSYMLSECATENKFLIVELSVRLHVLHLGFSNTLQEDIWIDTLVLANYEFFSSMIRTFRVSVSDRYPVKIDKWKDLGTYEARNSREIQAFLIENPQIWARYLRIEFLTHYGNEYYCPLSLVRVHGTRMLESWKETEANSEDDDPGDANVAVDQYVPEAVAEVIQEVMDLREVPLSTGETTDTAASCHISNESFEEHFLLESTPWRGSIFDGLSLPLESMCMESEVPMPPSASKGEADNRSETFGSGVAAEAPQSSSANSQRSSVDTAPFLTANSSPSQIQQTKPAANPTPMHNLTTLEFQSTATSKAASDGQGNSSTPVPPLSTRQNVTVSHKSTTTSSGSASLPTIQESFFKAVSRRLQLLENLDWKS